MVNYGIPLIFEETETLLVFFFLSFILVCFGGDVGNCSFCTLCI